MMSPVAAHSSPVFQRLVFLVPAVLLLTGCAGWGGSAGRAQQAAEPPGAEGSQKPVYSFRYPGEPPVLSAKDLQTFVAGFRPRVVLLDFWASWSRQSRDEMPDIIRLQEELGTDEFQVISCNLDAAQQWSTETVPLLRALHANFPCVVVRPQAKNELRTWLAPGWSFDLPARFILDSQGRVVGQALSGVAAAEVQDQARSLVSGGGEDHGLARLAAGTVALHVRLIDVRRGQSQSLPEVFANSADPAHLAAQASQQVATEIDRRLNARIAILPFPSSRNPARAETIGHETAEKVRQELRRRGYYDLMTPDQTEKMIAASGLTALSIDYEPAVVKGKLNCDFLVTGWIRGENPPDREQPDAAIGSGALEDQTEATVVTHPQPRE